MNEQTDRARPIALQVVWMSNEHLDYAAGLGWRHGWCLTVHYSDGTTEQFINRDHPGERFDSADVIYNVCWGALTTAGGITISADIRDALDKAAVGDEAMVAIGGSGHGT